MAAKYLEFNVEARARLKRGVDKLADAGVPQELAERVASLGALFAAFLTGGRPGPDWSEQTIEAIWPALAAA